MNKVDVKDVFTVEDRRVLFSIMTPTPVHTAVIECFDLAALDQSLLIVMFSHDPFSNIFIAP